ncbi:tape measure protein [Tsukamurella pulmonis]|uniref:tape measure protein n=1 Tax=Tsukamurella pulmonis TaxID=47312 RepID=UPI001EE0469C|nr:tape measure protein [Tsukamurella pulmonis]
MERAGVDFGRELSRSGQQGGQQLGRGIEQGATQAQRALGRPRDELGRFTRAANQAGQQAGEGLARGVRAGTDQLGRIGQQAGQRAGQGVRQGIQQSESGILGQFGGLGQRGANFLGSNFTKTFAALGIATSIGGILNAGFNRLEAIDTAKFKLTALGNDAARVEEIMKNASAAVTGTAFSMGDAATVAATATSAGIKAGGELERYLKIVAGTAAVTGSGLAEMGSIMNKVQVSGKAMTDDLQQIGDRGFDIWGALREQTGKTIPELQSMASEGKITSDVLQNALEKKVGNAAKVMGGSVRASIDNVKASIGRLGAAVLDPAFKALPSVLDGMMKGFDSLGKGVKTAFASEPVQKFVGQIREAGGQVFGQIGPAFTAVKGALTEAFRSEGFQEFLTKVREIGQSIGQNLVGTLQNIGKIAQDVGTLLVAAFKSDVFQTVLQGAIGLAGILGGALLTGFDLVSGAVEKVSDVVSTVTGFFRDNQDIVSTLAVAIAAAFVPALISMAVQYTAGIALGAAWIASLTAQKIAMAASAIAARGLGAAMALVGGPIGLIIAGITAVVAGLVWFFTQTEVGKKVWATAWGAIKDAAAAVVSWFTDTALPFLGKVWDNIKSGWNDLASAAGVLWDLITAPARAAVAFFTQTLPEVLSAAWALVKTGWNTLVDSAQAVWKGVTEKFTGMVDFVKSIPGEIASVASGMWDGISNAFKSTVNSMINVWNSFASKLSFTTPDWVPGIGGKSFSIPTIPNLRTGGIIRGPGTGTSDSILGVSAAGVPTARVSNGESVNTEESTRQNWWLFSQLNAGKTIGDVIGGMLPAFAAGGLVSGQQLTSFASGVEGKPYVWGGTNWGDCSGAVSAIANFATGRDPFSSRFATATEENELASRGFKPGLGPEGSLNIGWFNGGPAGGHTAATLPDGTNFEMGGQRGNGQFGGQAAGASDSQFTDHAHLPPEHFGGLDAGAGTYGGGAAASATTGAGSGAASSSSGAGGSGGSSSSSPGGTGSGAGQLSLQEEIQRLPLTMLESALGIKLPWLDPTSKSSTAAVASNAKDIAKAAGQATKDANAVTKAQDAVADKKAAVTLAEQRLTEAQNDPKAKESTKLAAQQALDKANRALAQAETKATSAESTAAASAAAVQNAKATTENTAAVTNAGKSAAAVAREQAKAQADRTKAESTLADKDAAVRLAEQKLTEANEDPKAKESKKLAARQALEKAQRDQAAAQTQVRQTAARAQSAPTVTPPAQPTAAISQSTVQQVGAAAGVAAGVGGVDTVPLIQNPDGTWTSSDPEWAKLIKRESGGKADIVQGIQDVNLFQITGGTWKANGGEQFAASAKDASPQQQAQIAARIFGKSGGSPWGSGAGQSGRENEAALRAGITRRGAPTTPTIPGSIPQAGAPSGAPQKDTSQVDAGVGQGATAGGGDIFTQGLAWGGDAVKEIGGEFLGMFGLDGILGRVVDAGVNAGKAGIETGKKAAQAGIQAAVAGGGAIPGPGGAVAGAAGQVVQTAAAPLAETVIFQGQTVDQVQSGVQRGLNRDMAPVRETLRGNA